MRTLLVASAGGHLTELCLLRDRLSPPPNEPVWVTYPSVQARSLLADEDRIDAFHPTTRSLVNAVRNYRLARQVFAEHRIDRVVSTGAGVAVPFMIRAWQLGIPCHYIESATRVSGPSLTGRILERVPGVSLYSQYGHWMRPRWMFAGSVFDGFQATFAGPREPASVLVTLGTHTYPFDSLVRSMQELLPPGADVVWQLGSTDRHDHLPGEVIEQMPAQAMDRLMADVDLVVSHAGTGTILTSLLAGRTPLVVPRRARRDEHVDDHQALIAREIEDRGLAVVREVELLGADDLRCAAGGRVERSPVEPFQLAGNGNDPRPAGPLRTPAQWRRRLGRMLAGVDAIVIGLSSLAAYLARDALGAAGLARKFQSEVVIALAVLPLWLAIFAAVGAYRPEYLNSGGDAFRRFAAGVAGGVLALGFVSFLFRLELSRLYVVFLLVLVFVLGGAARVWIRRLLARRYARGELLQNVLVVGADDDARDVVRAITSSRIAGYRVVGFLDEHLEPGDRRDGVEVLGSPEDVHEIASVTGAGLVLVSPTGVSPGLLRELTVALEGTPIDLAVAPSPFAVVSRRMTVESVANVPILHVDQIRLRRSKALAKRTLDLLVAVALGLLLVPVALLAAAAVKIGDGGPVLFHQQRIGKDGAPFVIRKFRTMRIDAEDTLERVAHLNEVGHAFFKIREDPRVTPVGRFLRKWSIDELPQLWNVIRGDMSMVGPRPPLPAEVEKYEPWHLRRLRVRPGITGIWQVSGRSEVPFEEAVRMDLFYIENWSLGYDLFLLGKTVLAVLGRHGAY